MANAESVINIHATAVFRKRSGCFARSIDSPPLYRIRPVLHDSNPPSASMPKTNQN